MPSDVFYADVKLTPEARPVRAVRTKAGPFVVALSIVMALAILSTIFGGQIGLAFAPLFVVAVLLFILRGEPVAAVAVFFGYAGLEGMFKYMSGFSPAIYVISPLLIGTIFSGWRMPLAMGNVKPIMPPLQALLATFLGWGLLQIFNPHGNGLLSGVVTLCLYYALPIALYVIGYNSVRSVHQVDLFLFSMVAVCTIVSLCSILQFDMGRPWTEAHFPGYHNITQGDWFVADDSGKGGVGSFRPASTTVIGGGGAIWAQWGTTLSLGLLFSPRLSAASKYGLALCLLLNIVTLFVSGVRLLLIMSLFNAMVFICVHARTFQEVVRDAGKVLAIIVIANVAFASAQAVSGGIIGARYAETARNPLAKYQHDRGGNLVSFATFALDYPLGAGYQMELGRIDPNRHLTDPATKERNGETEFAAIAGDMGLPGLVLLYAIVFGLLLLGWRSFRSLRDSHLRTVGAMLFASLSGYLPASFAGPALQDANYFWFAAAILLALPLVEAQGQRRLKRTSSVQST